MTTNLPPIYFYFSQYEWLCENMPDSPDVYQPYFHEQGISDGEICWILQTYLRLRDNGFPCELTGEMPAEGIVLAHRMSLPFNFKPTPKLLIICLKADKQPHPYAQLHVVQNSYERKLIENAYLMPHWPQQGLIPRDPARGDRFETVAYLGTGGNLASELISPAWREQLNQMGLKWCFKSRDQWHDYSDVDVVVAVRSFDPIDARNWKKDQGAWKPPTKLYNCWQAGVPAILGCEPGFQDERKNELDFIEVTSLDEVVAALKRLRDDKELRKAMLDNAQVRAEETKPERRIALWRNFLTEVAIPTYENWCAASKLRKQIFFKRKYFDIKVNGLRNRLQSLVSQIKL